MPQQLREFNREEIFSQFETIAEESQYQLDGSFVVDEVEEDNSEMSELEVAEMILEAERKSKKRRRKIL